MNILNKNKKGQGLPLQTIVIAILVIIVLLVIVVFFVSKMGDTGEGVDNAGSGFTKCEIGTYAISQDTYVDAKYDTKCTSDYKRIYTIPKNNKGEVCCAKPINKKPTEDD